MKCLGKREAPGIMVCVYCHREVKRKDQNCKVPASIQTIKDFPFVEEVSDERGLDQGIWAYLQPGWYWDDPSLHIIHEDTAEQVMKCLREILPCRCADCEKIIKQQLAKVTL